jgi:hypothetical protein
MYLSDRVILRKVRIMIIWCIMDPDPCKSACLHRDLYRRKKTFRLPPYESIGIPIVRFKELHFITEIPCIPWSVILSCSFMLYNRRGHRLCVLAPKLTPTLLSKTSEDHRKTHVFWALWCLRKPSNSLRLLKTSKSQRKRMYFEHFDF